ncbi:MAG: hypothetical protein HKN84_13840 [Gammaproteobacteria bacterium]|nr:hypothetical protein [Gammaproteobacteria bacterium]
MRFSKIFGGIMLLAFASTSATTLWAADESTPGAQDSDMLVTEYRGRPPFKRHFVSSEEIAELARFEESASRPTGESVRVADYRGRPPFKREILSSEEVVELARFEETSSMDTDRRTRRGPPGKLHSRR